MSLLQSFLLGLIQGITEFLPISSSAHLVLFPYLMGWQLNEDFIFPFNVLVQIGTLLAVIVYFRSDLKIICGSMIKGIKKGELFHEVPARTGWLTLLATIPAGLIGLSIRDDIAKAFRNPGATSLFLIVTAIFLVVSEFFGKRNRNLSEMRILDAVWIGLFQALSVFPGISRSGSTIAGGMTKHFERKIAGQFAFLMAIPIMLAAGVLGTVDLLKVDGYIEFLPSLIIGFITSAFFGFLSIRWMIKFISNHSLIPFAVYCFLFGAGTFGLTIFNPQNFIVGFGTNEDVPVYQISYEPELEWLLPHMTSCQKVIPIPNLLLLQRTWQVDQSEKTDLFMMYGEKPGLGKFSYQIGLDEIVPIAHPEIGFETASAQLIEEIFLNQLMSWNQVYDACPSCFNQFLTGEEQTISIYTYPPQTSISLIFSDSILGGAPVSARINIAPNASTMKQAIQKEKYSIGYLPKSWVDDSIKAIDVSVTGDEKIIIPIIAAGDNQLNATLDTWLKCVQNKLNTN